MMRSLVLVGVVAVMAQEPRPAKPGAGIPFGLAEYRARTIHHVRYELAFDIPANQTEPVRGRERVRFELSEDGPVTLDFAVTPDHLLSVTMGPARVDVNHVNGHLVLPADRLHRGENVVDIEFAAGDVPLNRSPEFLYTLFVPARASQAFPCFDQPDLKAQYSLTLTAPALWQVVANGAEAGREVSGDRMTVRFAETAPLPTYLFAFAAGKFSVEEADRGGRHLRMFHRETDAAKVARNREAIFDLHAAALDWLERHTAIPYRFGKFDFILIPAFQFGGMEHAGAILYNASGLMLDETATQNQKLGRASVIAHETSHMWFGDLVTMKWFNDVWMKEVFANFMAAKIVNPSFPEINHELRFLLAHYPAAYDMDRTEGTNAIRQPLANLNEAGSLYGAIIYEKAPTVMRQLEERIGAERLQEGLREYLKRYAFGNATWPDLIAILDAAPQVGRDAEPPSETAKGRLGPPDRAPQVGRDAESPSETAKGRPRPPDRAPQVGRDAESPSETAKGRPRPHVSLREWSEAWVSEQGRPTIRTGLRIAKGRIARLAFEQSDPFPPRALLWPQRLDVTLGYAAGDRTIRADLNDASVALDAAAGLEAPRFVLPNGRGRGYGRFVLDPRSLTYLLDHVEDVSETLTRGGAWVTLWDAMLDRGASPARFAAVCLRALPQERDEQLTQRVLGYLEETYWKFLTADQRLALAPRVEGTLRDGLARAGGASLKSAWFSAFRNMTLTPEGIAWLERVWRRQETIPGLTFSEDDETAMAQALAVRAVSAWAEILREQHARIANPDRKARFAFIMPALSADARERDRFVSGLTDAASRRHESWVLDGLRSVHHALRATESEQYVVPALRMLPDIQRTGDIFFPKRWTDAVLSGHSAPATADAVRQFIRNLPPDYPLRLRKILLSSADELFRAAAR